LGGARRLLLHDGIVHYFSSVPEWWGRRGRMTVYRNIIQGEKKMMMMDKNKHQWNKQNFEQKKKEDWSYVKDEPEQNS
jgi:hypothetical protein